MLASAHFDGQADFYLPTNRDHVSHSTVSAKEFSADSISVSMIRLSTAMNRLGHSQIDVLKMDIEGEEYPVLEDMVRERIPVRQLLNRVSSPFFFYRHKEDQTGYIHAGGIRFESLLRLSEGASSDDDLYTLRSHIEST